MLISGKKRLPVVNRLKLKPTKAPLDVLVIDHVEMPSAN
jgi:hypothetical protein